MQSNTRQVRKVGETQAPAGVGSVELMGGRGGQTGGGQKEETALCSVRTRGGNTSGNLRYQQEEVIGGKDIFYLLSSHGNNGWGLRKGHAKNLFL